MSYGIPYKGSKNKIIKWLLPLLPRGEVFVDLFCGGCSVTHAAMLQRKYKRYIINDINPMMPRTFQKALAGGYRNENRWISREDFFRLKDSDEYAAICFSFGNNLRDYIYASKLEPYKRACHFAIVFDDWSEMNRLCPHVVAAVYNALSGIKDLRKRRVLFGAAVLQRLKSIGDVELVVSNPLYLSCHKKHDRRLNSIQNMCSFAALQSLEQLERLEHLERLESIESLERLQDSFLTSFAGDYQDVVIPPGAVVYCDIPYKGTNVYDKSNPFDYDRFYHWALTRDFPVFVSEYQMPEGFTCIGGTARADSMAATSTSKRIERLFVQDRFAAQSKPKTLFDW